MRKKYNTIKTLAAFTALAGGAVPLYSQAQVKALPTIELNFGALENLKESEPENIPAHLNKKTEAELKNSRNVTSKNNSNTEDHLQKSSKEISAQGDLFEKIKEPEVHAKNPNIIKKEEEFVSKAEHAPLAEPKRNIFTGLFSKKQKSDSENLAVKEHVEKLDLPAKTPVEQSHTKDTNKEKQAASAAPKKENKSIKNQTVKPQKSKDKETKQAGQAPKPHLKKSEEIAPIAENPFNNTVKKEEAKKAADLAREAEDKKLAEEAKAAQLKKEAEAKKAADAQKEAQLKKEAEEKKAADAAKAAELAREAEAKKLAEAEKEAQLKKEAEAKKLAEAQKEAQLKKELEEKKAAAEAAKAAELAKEAEAKKLADAQKEAQLKKEVEEKKAAEAAKAAELAKEAEAKKLAEAEKEAQLKKEAEEKKAADAAKAAELAREAEAKKLADAEKEAQVKKDAEAKKAADVAKEAELKKQAEAKKAAEIQAANDAQTALKKEEEAKKAQISKETAPVAAKEKEVSESVWQKFLEKSKNKADSNAPQKPSTPVVVSEFDPTPEALASKNEVKNEAPKKVESVIKNIPSKNEKLSLRDEDPVNFLDMGVEQTESIDVTSPAKTAVVETKPAKIEAPINSQKLNLAEKKDSKIEAAIPALIPGNPKPSASESANLQLEEKMAQSKKILAEKTKDMPLANIPSAADKTAEKKLGDAIDSKLTAQSNKMPPVPEPAAMPMQMAELVPPENAQAITITEVAKAPAAADVKKEPEISNQNKLLSVAFDKNGANLSKADQESVHKLVKEILNSTKRLKVMSYASGVDGEVNSARRISLQRAIAIRSYMISAGLEKSRINVQAMGNNPEAQFANSANVYVVE